MCTAAMHVQHTHYYALMTLAGRKTIVRVWRGKILPLYPEKLMQVLINTSVTIMRWSMSLDKVELPRARIPRALYDYCHCSTGLCSHFMTYMMFTDINFSSSMRNHNSTCQYYMYMWPIKCIICSFLSPCQAHRSKKWLMFCHF